MEVEAASSDDDDDSGGGVDAVVDDDDESEAPSATTAPSIKCVMCGKQFVHQANLRQHLKVHLGAKAQLQSCQPCDRYGTVMNPLQSHSQNVNFLLSINQTTHLFIKR